MTPDPADSLFEDFRQSLASLLHSDFSNLREEVAALQTQLEQLEALSTPLPADLDALRDTLRRLSEKTNLIDGQVLGLQSDLADPARVASLIKPSLGPALQQGIADEPERFSEAIAPVIAPAIQNQIRNARTELIIALYPIMGQTIRKAISEAFQDLRRRIDAQLKQNLNLRGQVRRWVSRLRGVSDSDLILRQSLPYNITHVFLIHRETGLLLKQVSSTTEVQDSDLISAMLTAIRSFAKGALGAGEGELEEIQHGLSHILLKSGQYAYLAAVLEGTPPPGYASLMQQIIHELNLEHESKLESFSGEMDRLPDFAPRLRPLLNPPQEEWEAQAGDSSLSRGQKSALLMGAAGLMILLALVIFACVFTYRLWPVAFPAPTTTATPSPTSTATATASPTRTATASVTPFPTLTPTPVSTFTPSPTAGTWHIKAVMAGHEWVHLEPDLSSKVYPEAITAGTTVEVKAAYGEWAKIIWSTGLGDQDGWVLLKWISLTGDTIPPELMTPTP